MDTIGFYIFFSFLLLLFSAFFSGSETVFFSLGRTRLAGLKKSKLKRDKKLLSMLTKPRKVLATALLGNEFVNICFSILVASFLRTIFIDRWGEEVTGVVSILVATSLLLILGEIFPKSISIRLAPKMASWVGIPFRFISFLLSPFTFLLAGIADGFIRFFGGEPNKETPLIMEEEFRHLVDLGANIGEVEPEEKKLIHNIFDFRDKVARDVMTPIEQVFALSIHRPFEKLLEEIRATQFSRIPVYGEDPDEFVGILHVRDLFGFNRRRKANETLSVEEILRPALTVAEDRKLDLVLAEFRRLKIHMAIVVNPMNTPLGIVTMGDLLSELFDEMGGLV